MTAVATGRTDLTCPKCSGPMWDETKSKFYKAGKPIAKCKDKGCDGVLWAAKPTAQTVGTNTAAASPIDIDSGLNMLFTVYDECYAHALSVARRSREKHDLGFTAEGVAAIAATLIIAAQKKGIV